MTVMPECDLLHFWHMPPYWAGRVARVWDGDYLFELKWGKVINMSEKYNDIIVFTIHSESYDDDVIVTNNRTYDRASEYVSHDSGNFELTEKVIYSNWFNRCTAKSYSNNKPAATDTCSEQESRRRKFWNGWAIVFNRYVLDSISVGLYGRTHTHFSHCDLLQSEEVSFDIYDLQIVSTAPSFKLHDAERKIERNI